MLIYAIMGCTKRRFNMVTQLPESFIQQMKELLKDEFEAYIQSFEHERYYGLRVNTNKISVQDLKYLLSI